jgi:hypothetical protein
MALSEHPATMGSSDIHTYLGRRGGAGKRASVVPCSRAAPKDTTGEERSTFLLDCFQGRGGWHARVQWRQAVHVQGSPGVAHAQQRPRESDAEHRLGRLDDVRERHCHLREGHHRGDVADRVEQSHGHEGLG